MSMLYGMAVQMMAVERNGEEKVEKTMFFFWSEDFWLFVPTSRWSFSCLRLGMKTVSTATISNIKITWESCDGQVFRPKYNYLISSMSLPVLDKYFFEPMVVIDSYIWSFQIIKKII